MKNAISHFLNSKIFCFFLALLICGVARPQVFQVPIDSTYTNNAVLSFTNITIPISRMSLAGNVELNSDTSLVRVILIDVNDFQYLVFESYPMIDTLTSFSVDNFCYETCILNDIIIKEIVIQIYNASFHFDYFEYSAVKTAFNQDTANKIIDNNELPRRRAAGYPQNKDNCLLLCSTV